MTIIIGLSLIRNCYMRTEFLILPTRCQTISNLHACTYNFLLGIITCTVEPRLSGHLGFRGRPDNRIDKPRLDPPTLLINSSATWLSAHAQKISRPVSIVTAAMRMRISGTHPFSELLNLIQKKLPSRIIEVLLHVTVHLSDLQCTCNHEKTGNLSLINILGTITCVKVHVTMRELEISYLHVNCTYHSGNYNVHCIHVDH